MAESLDDIINRLNKQLKLLDQKRNVVEQYLVEVVERLCRVIKLVVKFREIRYGWYKKS